MWKSSLLWFLAAILAAMLAAVFAPLEKTLGANARIVYLHGAWVWAAMFFFLAAAAAGVLGLLTRQARLHSWSRAFGRSGLFFWLTFLPMSLYVMQANWNGLFLDEPRFRLPLNLAVVGLLLQIGLACLPVIWSSVGNLAFGAALLLTMGGADTVLHPDSPIFNSDARDIQVYFIVLLLLLAAAGWFQARWWYQRDLHPAQDSLG